MTASGEESTPTPPPARDRLATLLSMLDLEPLDAFCLYGIAQEHSKVGRYEEALLWFDRAIAADPDSAYAYFHKARALEELERIPEAIAVLREGLLAAARSKDGHATSELRGFLDQLT